MEKLTRSIFLPANFSSVFSIRDFIRHNRQKLVFLSFCGPIFPSFYDQIATTGCPLVLVKLLTKWSENRTYGLGLGVQFAFQFIQSSDYFRLPNAKTKMRGPQRDLGEYLSLIYKRLGQLLFPMLNFWRTLQSLEIGKNPVFRFHLTISVPLYSSNFIS